LHLFHYIYRMKYAWLLLLCCVCGFANAQQVMETYTPANGLVDARVSKIVQDKFGRLWFLTREGFSKFDGQRFTNYLSVDGVQAGITDNSFFLPDSALCLVSSNAIVFKVSRSGVTADTAMLKGVSEISYCFTISPGDYLLVANNGLFRYTNGRLRALSSKSGDKIFNPQIFGGCMTWHHYLIFGYAEKGESTVCLYDIDREQITDQLPFALSAVQKDIKRGIYIQSGRQHYGLSSAALEQGRLQLTPNPYLQHLPPGVTPLRFMFGTNGSAFCVDSKENLLEMKPAGEKFQYAASSTTIKNISSVFNDRESNTWLIISGGVQKIVQSPVTQIKNIGAQSIVQPYHSYAIPGGGVYLNNGTSQLIIKKDSAANMGTVAAADIDNTFYWNQDVWTFRDKYTLTSKKGKKIMVPMADTGRNGLFLSGKAVTDKRQNLLIAGNHLYAFTPQGTVLATPLFYFNDNIAVDEKEQYWAFTRAGRAERFVLENDGFRRTAFYKIPIPSPRCAIHWSRDTFLIGTRNNGLFFVTAGDTAIKLLSAINRAKGLSNNFVINCIKLKNGKVVAGTAGGLDIVSFANGDTSIQRLSLLSNNFDPILNLIATEDDNVYAINEFRTSLFYYEANRFSGLPYRPNAYIDKVFMNGTVVENGHTRFSYRENNFLFQAAAPSYIDNKNINFFFTLDGKGGQHTAVNNTGVFEMNNLEPGSYRLVIKVVYPGKIYPDEFLNYDFVINKPFWKTAWFAALIFVTAGGLIVLFTRLYFQQQLRKREAELQKQQAVEKERTRIATDMHDDFGASLSRIKFLSEKLKLKKGGDALLNTDLDKISGYSDEMAEKMNEIVWALNQRYDTVGDLVAFSRAWASEYLQANDLSLKFSSNEAPDIKIPGEVRRNIFLVLKESLHNVVKHAGAGQVQITFIVNANIAVTISDNGRGIDTAHIRPFANGLENMKKRIVSIGGQISIDNSGGTTIAITVPLNTV
jgi:signal transduction histidine kinase